MPAFQRSNPETALGASTLKARRAAMMIGGRICTIMVIFFRYS